MKQLTFKEIETIPAPPGDTLYYDDLAEKFSRHVHDRVNRISHEDDAGNTYFAAYSEGQGNEMVTWGPIAVGEKFRLSEHWRENANALEKFFHPGAKVYTNTHGQTKTEYWYLLYVHTLAGTVYRSYFEKDARYLNHMLTAAYSLRTMAQGIKYDFNDQGYDFNIAKPWTNKDVFRQPDSIGGYAYNMLFAGIHGGDDSLIAEAVKAIKLYENFEKNPWYEIPNGSTAFYAAAWLKAKGYKLSIEKILGFVLDPKEGPLHTGKWNGEPVDGLMMGWRGDDRESAMSSAYSMETLMPLPFVIPAVKYAPETAKSVAWYALNAVMNFKLFFAEGLNGKIHETRADLSNAVPYERLEIKRDGHSPVACGDFMGHRSVYGGAYMAWIAAIMRRTGVKNMPAWDISITDWLDKSKAPEPMFMLYNETGEEAEASFAPCNLWKEKRPDLYQSDVLTGNILNHITNEQINEIRDGKVRIKVPPRSVLIVKLTP